MVMVWLCCLDMGCRTDHNQQPDEAVPFEMFDIQGHRGARGLLPENTLPSFHRAIEIGVQTLEMDVVISADNQVVVSHDPLMSASICSHPDGRPVLEEEAASLVLYKMRYEEIQRYDCGSRGNAAFPGQAPTPAYKPLLGDVIDLGERETDLSDRPSIHYNVEVKSTIQGDGERHPDPSIFARLVLDVVATKGVEARTTIQSFDPRILQALQAPDRVVDLALLVGRSEDLGIAANLQVLGFTPQIYSPDYRLVDEVLVEAVHNHGMMLIPWTVNDPNEMARLRTLGVDGLITDFPDIAVDRFR